VILSFELRTLSFPACTLIEEAFAFLLRSILLLASGAIALSVERLLQAGNLFLRALELVLKRINLFARRGLHALQLNTDAANLLLLCGVSAHKTCILGRHLSKGGASGPPASFKLLKTRLHALQLALKGFLTVRRAGPPSSSLTFKLGVAFNSLLQLAVFLLQLLFKLDFTGGVTGGRRRPTRRPIVR
jgi:hypothetical protein